LNTHLFYAQYCMYAHCEFILHSSLTSQSCTSRICLQNPTQHCVTLKCKIQKSFAYIANTHSKVAYSSVKLQVAKTVSVVLWYGFPNLNVIWSISFHCWIMMLLRHIELPPLEIKIGQLIYFVLRTHIKKYAFSLNRIYPSF